MFTVGWLLCVVAAVMALLWATIIVITIVTICFAVIASFFLLGALVFNICIVQEQNKSDDSEHEHSGLVCARNILCCTGVFAAFGLGYLFGKNRRESVPSRISIDSTPPKGNSRPDSPNNKNTTRKGYREPDPSRSAFVSPLAPEENLGLLKNDEKDVISAPVATRIEMGHQYSSGAERV